jgi:SAM-dependent methyltransferase
MTPHELAARSKVLSAAPSIRTGAPAARPAFRWSHVFESPLHDFPIRDEILFQFLALAPGCDVLEIGPGTGFTAFRLASQVGHMTLLDVAPRAVEELRQTLAHIPNIRFVCADVAGPDLIGQLERKFDAAYGLDMLEYVTDPAACLANLASALRPGGQLLLSFPNVPPPDGDGVTWFTDLAVLEAMLERAGFASWSIYAVRLRRVTAALYAVLHEWPLRLYRRVRRSDRRARPQIYEATWAFQHRQRLSRYKTGLHLYWLLLGWTMRLAGSVFVTETIGDRPLGRQLVIRATR